VGQGAVEKMAKKCTIKNWKKHLIPGKLYEHTGEGSQYRGPFMFVKFERYFNGRKHPLVFLDTTGELRHASCTSWAPPDIFWKRLL